MGLCFESVSAKATKKLSQTKDDNGGVRKQC